MITRATNQPLRRLVDGGSAGPLVLEVRGDTFTLRPYRARSGAVAMGWGKAYATAILSSVLVPRSRRRVGRGMLREGRRK